MKYSVSWHVEVEAENPEAAARTARGVQRSEIRSNITRGANRFHVTPAPVAGAPTLTTVVDLDHLSPAVKL